MFGFTSPSPKLGTLQGLAISHVGVSKTVLSLIVTSVVIKLDGWF